MKKFIATTAALGLVFGAAGAASAVDFKIKGKYVLEGYYLSDTGHTARAGALLTGTRTDSDAYWMHTFSFKPTMKVNDKITVRGDIRLFKEAVWGTGLDDRNRDLDIDKIFMDYLSPIGKIRVGRTPAGTFGGQFLNRSTSANRVMWWPSFVSDPWNLLLFTQKSVERDAVIADRATDRVRATDRDSDVYKVQLGHKSDKGRALVEYIRTRHGHRTGGTHNQNIDHIGIWGKYKFAGNYTMETEIAHRFGDGAVATGRDSELDAWAFMADITGQFDALTAGFIYFYMSGDSNPNDRDNESALAIFGGTGFGFKPLTILTGDHTGILNDDLSDFGGGRYPTVQTDANLANAGVQAFIFHTKYKVSDRLTLCGALGIAMAVDEMAGVDDELGTEINIGASYKLLDNLTYRASFGYLDTGDFFKGTDANINVNEITLLSHHLTMKF